MAARVLVVQHAADDGPGRVGAGLVAAGCTLAVVRCDLGEPLPDSLAGYDGLLVLGGSMGVHDDDSVPWLRPVKGLLREAVHQDLPTLAICLGHQLLAVAAGGRVDRRVSPQVGPTGVVLTEAGRQDRVLGPVPEDAVAVHWNNDRVAEAPPGAVVLAEYGSAVQALRFGQQVWGVQFHPEVDVPTVAAWAAYDVADGTRTAEQSAALGERVAAVDDRLAEVWGAMTVRFAARVRASDMPPDIASDDTPGAG